MTLAESQSKDLTYQQLLDLDTHEVNPMLRLTSDVDFGTMNIPVERYLSQDFFDLEVEKILRKIPFLTWKLKRYGRKHGKWHAEKNIFLTLAIRMFMTL